MTATTAPRPQATIRPEVADLHHRPHAEVLVIGGGINGVGVFRDLAAQGIDVTLVERGDIAHATSAASSRMIHGGLRYLENGEFRLVRESVAERNRLLANAPHYVKPLPTTIPIRRVLSGITTAPLRFLGANPPVKERGAAIIWMGLTLYDIYSRIGRAAHGTPVPFHRFAGTKRTRAELPDLSRDMRFTATYYDATIREPERLALEVALDGLESPTARAATYVSVVGNADGALALRDEVTGEQFSFSADLVINASGPWTDLTNAAMGRATTHMGGTKGSHIVVDNPALHDACDGREIFFENSDGRIVLLHPVKGKVLVGTTDLPADPREPARCTEEEVDYFIELAALVFPEIPINRDQIVYRFSGIRPLPASDASQPGQISRDYEVVASRMPGSDARVLSIVGGKWTTFRALGEQVGDVVLGHLGRERTVDTAAVPVGGGKGYPLPEYREQWYATQLEVDDHRGAAMLQRYGTRAVQVAAHERSMDDADAAAPLAHLPGFTRAEVDWIARTERVVRLADMVLRRTSLAFTGDLTRDGLEQMADIVSAALGWDESRRRDEIDATLTALADDHQVTMDTTAAAASR